MSPTPTRPGRPAPPIPTRLAFFGQGLGGAMCGGSVVGAAEGLYLLAITRPSEYQAFAYGAVLYGLAGLVVGLPLAALLAMFGRPAGLGGPRAWSASFAAASASLATFVLAGGEPHPLVDALGVRPSLAYAAMTGAGALVLAWFGGHLLAKTPLRVLATLRGTLLAWVGAVAIAALLSASPAPGAADTLAPGRPAPEGKPDIVLIVVDGLRADAVERGPASRTPALAALADDAVSFEQAVAGSGDAAPALATLLTAAPPSIHGLRSNGDVLGSAPPTVAEVLRDGGYVTGGVPATVDTAGSRGLDRGFDWYRLDRADPLGARESAAGLELYGRLRARWEHRTARPAVGAWHAPAGEQLGRGWDFLSANADARAFLFVELAEPDLPWFTAEGEAVGGARRQPADAVEARALYGAEVARVDAALGAFLARLRGAGRYEDALVVLVGSRGASLGEDGGAYGAGAGLHDAVLRVPLLVKLPGGARAGTRVPWQVRAVDVAPTLAELAGFAPAEGWRGATVFDDWFEDDLARLSPPPVDEGEGAPGDAPPDFVPPGWAEHPGSRPALAERHGPRGHLVAVRTDGRKLVRTRGGLLPASSCHDLAADPAEADALPDDDPGCRAADIADALLGGWTGVRPPPTPPEDDAEPAISGVAPLDPALDPKD